MDQPRGSYCHGNICLAPFCLLFKLFNGVSLTKTVFFYLFQQKKDNEHSEDIPLTQIDLSVPLHVPGTT